MQYVRSAHRTVCIRTAYALHTHCIRTKFSVLEPLASAAAERRSGTLEVESACEAGGVRHVAAGSRASQLVAPSVFSAPLSFGRALRHSETRWWPRPVALVHWP